MLKDVEVEEKRSVYQMGKLEEKIDRVDTTVKKINLILEGVPETDGNKEIVEKSIWNLFDQLNINGEINFDACYRQGPYNKNRIRAIIITFQKQTGLCVSCRMNLEGDPRNFYDGRSIEIRVKFVLRRKISTRDNLLREKVSQGVLYYRLGSYTTGQNL